MTQKQERIMPSQNAFAPLPAYVKKALGNLKVVGPAAEAITTACDAIGVGYQSPGLVGDSAIHFIFPKLEAGLLLKAKANNAPTFKHKVMKCRKLGWNITVVTSEDIEVLPQEVITANLKEFIENVMIVRNANKSQQKNGKFVKKYTKETK